MDVARSAVGSDQADSLLKNRAYEVIRERIVSGELVPGDRISERSLGSELAMSKTPVKAALERLEEQGFVSLSPQRRATVRAMTSKEISDHYELRIALETFVVERLTGRLDDATIETVTDNLRLQQMITTGGGALEGWREADYGFHLALARALGNNEIVRIIALHRDRLYRLVAAIARQDPSVPAVSFREHCTIFEHVREGRREEAVAAVTSHLDHGRRFAVYGDEYGGGVSGTAARSSTKVADQPVNSDMKVIEL